MNSHSAPIKVAVLDDYQGAAMRFGDWRRLDGRAAVTVFRDHLSDDDAVAARLADFDVVCMMRERTPINGAMIARLPRLKMIATAASWNAALDIKAALARGIVVSGTRGSGNGTPELTWLLMLALARNIAAETASVQSGGWQTGVGVDLEGRTLGLLGLGNIGQRVAKVANAFGMNVIAWSHNLNAERCVGTGARSVTLDELLARSDFVSMHLKLSDRTRGLMGEREFALMKPSAYFVNTSRGPLVSEDALVAAVESKRIAGAAIDVFDVEPLPPDHRLRNTPGLIATPHIGYVTESALTKFFADMVEDISAWLDGSPVRCVAADANP